MAMSTRERISKLREAEFKLQQLQNDLLNGEKDAADTMSDFLAHHKELMALPTQTKDTLPFRFSFESPKKYREMNNPHQKLTLPPKLDAKSNSRLKPYKEPAEEAEKSQRNSVGFASHPSLALRAFLQGVNEKTSKLSVGFPKVDRFAMSTRAQFSRSIQPHNSKRYVKSTSNTKYSTSKSGSISNNKSTMSNSNVSSTSFLFLRGKAGSIVVKNENENKSSHSSSKSALRTKKFELSSQVSKLPSATASLLLKTGGDVSSSKVSVLAQVPPNSKNDSWVLPKAAESVRPQSDLAYGLGTANLMGVILPPKSANKRGLSQWDPVLSAFKDEVESMTTKDALNVLKRRKFPIRKSTFPTYPLPHERGLIGVEIAEFLPQCAYFYRDRRGNYNPHLPHSKAVTESMQKRWYPKTSHLKP